MGNSDHDIAAYMRRRTREFKKSPHGRINARCFWAAIVSELAFGAYAQWDSSRSYGVIHPDAFFIEAFLAMIIVLVYSTKRSSDCFRAWEALNPIPDDIRVNLGFPSIPERDCCALDALAWADSVFVALMVGFAIALGSITASDPKPVKLPSRSVEELFDATLFSGLGSIALSVLYLVRRNAILRQSKGTASC